MPCYVIFKNHLGLASADLAATAQANGTSAVGRALSLEFGRRLASGSCIGEMKSNAARLPASDDDRSQSSHPGQRLRDVIFEGLSRRSVKP